MSQNTAHLFTLIDAYATAAAAREDARSMAPWAFAESHARMLDARAAVATALGRDAAGLPLLTDDTTRCAEDAAARQAEWAARVDAAVAATDAALLEAAR